MSSLKALFTEYTFKDWLKSYLTSLLFLLVFSAILLIPTINLLLLYIPYQTYFFIFIYISVTIISYVCNRIYVSTLKNYLISENINYQVIVLFNTGIYSFIALVAIIIAVINIH